MGFGQTPKFFGGLALDGLIFGSPPQLWVSRTGPGWGPKKKSACKVFAGRPRCSFLFRSVLLGG